VLVDAKVLVILELHCNPLKSPNSYCTDAVSVAYVYDIPLVFPVGTCGVCRRTASRASTVRGHASCVDVTEIIRIGDMDIGSVV
jgi:hypothetical protein